MSVSDVGQTFTTSLGRIGAGLASGTSVGGLVVSHLFGYIVRLRMLRSERYPFEALVRAWSARAALFRCAREYKDFPLYDAPASLAANLSTKLPLFALGMIFSPAAAGFYAMADRVIGVPMQTAGISIRRVFMRKVAELRAQGRPVVGPYCKIVGVLAASGLVPFLILRLGGEDAMALVLGENWRMAGRYAEILSPWLLSAWIALVVPTVMIAFGRQRLWAATQVSSVVARAGVFAAAYVFAWQPETALSAFVWLNVSISILLLLFAWRIVTRQDAGPS